jgi:hypothetical protein
MVGPREYLYDTLTRVSIIQLNANLAGLFDEPVYGLSCVFLRTNFGGLHVGPHSFFGGRLNRSDEKTTSRAGASNEYK